MTTWTMAQPEKTVRAPFRLVLIFLWNKSPYPDAAAGLHEITVMVEA